MRAVPLGPFLGLCLAWPAWAPLLGFGVLPGPGLCLGIGGTSWWEEEWSQMSRSHRLGTLEPL